MAIDAEERRVPVAHRGMILRQLLLLASAALLPMRPWAVGTAIVLPLHAASDGETLAWVLSADTRLLGAGSHRGSMLVNGSRPRLLLRGLMHGALVIGAGAPLCGKQEAGR